MYQCRIGSQVVRRPRQKRCVLYVFVKIRLDISSSMTSDSSLTLCRVCVKPLTLENVDTDPQLSRKGIALVMAGYLASCRLECQDLTRFSSWHSVNCPDRSACPGFEPKGSGAWVGGPGEVVEQGGPLPMCSSA